MYRKGGYIRRLLMTILIAGMGQQALATRIQPPPDLICDPSQVELLAGVISKVETMPLSLRLFLQSDWGTDEVIDIHSPGSTNAMRVSQRSVLQTPDLSTWLKHQGKGSRIRFWECTGTRSQRWEILDTN